ncbi:MAG: UDP-N-acetylmuramoyl-tripeptide--D-alanyl-D-alanine ligase [Patescibacteria group bacterium]
MKNNLKKIVTFILILESKLILWKYKPRIVAITGTVGKTSTKDAIYQSLSQFYFIRKSDKSYNSEIGLPLTILGVPNAWDHPIGWLKNLCYGLWLFIWPHTYPEWLVLEVGVGKPGDMARTALWLKTDVVVITAIGQLPVHIEFFNSREHLIKEKAGLIKTLKKDGVLILNADDDAVLDMKVNSKHTFFTYGFNSNADVVASSEQISYTDGKNGEIIKPDGIAFRVDVEGKSLPVQLDGVFGKNHIYSALASITFSFSQKLNLLTTVNALKKFDAPLGRMHLLSGINDTSILDDTYNSSPFATTSALKTLGILQHINRKIAVLGDMLELGKHTEEAHYALGILVKENNIDILCVVGPRAKFIKQGAIQAGMKEDNIFEFDTSREVGEFLKSFIIKGDCILIKGSQGMRMERTVEAILLDIKNKKNLLVRQDVEWVNKL